MSYLQEVAENFYPERADFTTELELGDDVASINFSSQPQFVRRELANNLDAFLRPPDWFSIHVRDEATDEDVDARKHLEWMTLVQRRAMYDDRAGLPRALKQTDNDWVAFGMGVLEVDVFPDRSSMLFRNGHLRDHAWTENYAGVIDTIHRKWQPTARQIVGMFPKTVDAKVSALVTKEPDRKIPCRRIVIPAGDYDLDKKRAKAAPFVSIYVDCENETVLEEAPILWNPFVIPRWETVLQYGWSPVTGPGLADARVLNTLVRALLEGTEKAVDPVMAARAGVVRSDYSFYAGGVVEIDDEWDDKKGPPIWQLSEAKGGGLPLGIDMSDRLRAALTEGFFLNKLTLPENNGQMTAYQVRKIIEEHIRSATPIIAPAQTEYNAALCERSLEVLLAMKAFGPDRDVPDILRGQNIRYEFRSPVSDMTDEIKAQTYMEVVGIAGAAANVDPAQVKRINWDVATKDAYRGAGAPAKWMLSDEDFAGVRQAEDQKQKLQMGVQAIGALGGAAEAAGKGGAAINEALMPPQQAQPQRRAAA